MLATTKTLSASSRSMILRAGSKSAAATFSSAVTTTIGATSSQSGLRKYHAAPSATRLAISSLSSSFHGPSSTAVTKNIRRNYSNSDRRYQLDEEVSEHAKISTDSNVLAPPMVYISGEEMTNYACQLCVEQWFKPYFDLSQWEYFDMSCKARDESNDQVLRDAVEAGKQIGSIFKEPTITPTAIQQEQMGLSQPLPSPNGQMRKGWNGITISRDTIHIEGIELGYKNPVLFERHAVGGEYGAGWDSAGKGTLLTTYLPGDDQPPFVVDKRDLTDEHNVVVVYHNPYDNVEELAHFFFKRCLKANVTPYVVTKKTVFKWQERFWSTHKDIFDKFYKEQFLSNGLLEKCGGELQHLISDAATMQLVRWTDGGFGMSAHNYDGDMLTDEIAQIHRSPGFITSNLVGQSDDGSLIKEFEASHGTVSDLWHDHLDGKETSLNPLGMVEAIIGAMEHAAELQVEKAGDPSDKSEKEMVRDQVHNFTTTLRTAMHNTFRYGQGTRDMSGPSGFTTEDFITKVAWRLDRYLARQFEETPPPHHLSQPDRKFRRNYNIDEEAVNNMFQKYDTDSNGFIDYEEFKDMLVNLNLAPKVEKTDDEP